MNSAAALLDALMGKDRNAVPSQRQTVQKSWKDKDVCQQFIVGFCTSELFPNTKVHVGDCKLEHDEKFKIRYHCNQYHECFQSKLQHRI